MTNPKTTFCFFFCFLGIGFFLSWTVALPGCGGIQRRADHAVRPHA